MMRKLFEDIWNVLRAKKYTDFLERINIKELRGIYDLDVDFKFPVSVIAGENASGKTTVLFACACAYQVPHASNKDYVPSTLFPNFKTEQAQMPNDVNSNTAFEFYYMVENKKNAMRWAKGKSWNRSYMGKKKGIQPQRQVYLRTLANLTSPSEVRSVLQIAKTDVRTETITSDLLSFAQRILPMRYASVQKITNNEKELLFAIRENQSQYSEFHMSAGERAILRISKEISNLENALILIDEIETGLHPYLQQQMMLELQRLAVRNNLQIIVTSHSPVILESVPLEARIFLERIENNVRVIPAYKNIFQKAFYGQSLDKIHILCEDDIAESFLRGILDELNPELGLLHEDVIVGRDTGKDSFPQHIEAIAKFGKLDDFIFVLDGDAKPVGDKLRAAGERFNKVIQPLYLPDNNVPEQWAWHYLQELNADNCKFIGLTVDNLSKQLQKYDQLFDNATDKPSEKMKNKFHGFCENVLKRETREVMRILARNAIQQKKENVIEFVKDFKEQLNTWLTRKS